MRQQHIIARGTRGAGRLGGLLLVSTLLALALLSQAQAQETVVRIEIDAPEQPVPAGEEFEARVVVENVEHLAGFDFTIRYDPDRVRPAEEEPSQEAPPPGGFINVRVLDVGQFITANGQRQDMICDDPKADEAQSTVTVSCVTVGPPLCLGGESGASGSGVLGRAVFESRGGGNTTLELTKTTLVLDDVIDCDPEVFTTQQIQHRREDATVELRGGGGGAPWVAIGAGIGVGALLLIGGLAGFAAYRRRGAGTSP